MQEAEELYDLREALEAFAVEKAMPRLDAKSLARLEEQIDLYGKDTTRRFSRERLIYDQNIHLEIARIAGNETVKKTLSQVFERIILKRKTDALYDQARGVNAHEEHLKLLDAMRKGNVEHAVRNVRAHIQAGKHNVVSDLKQRKAIRAFYAIGR
jgi:DNA-binding GntR family transcriptional regulator